MHNTYEIRLCDKPRPTDLKPSSTVDCRPANRQEAESAEECGASCASFPLTPVPSRLPNVVRRFTVPFLSPPTLTKAEQQTLLAVSAVHPRDHLVFSLALGTGLRLAEVVGLDVGDVFTADGTPRSRIRLRREIAKNGRASDVFLPDALQPKLARLRAYKVRSGESVDPRAPLFCNQSGHRISKRRVQLVFKTWQQRARFDRHPPHSWTGVYMPPPRATRTSVSAGPK